MTTINTNVSSLIAKDAIGRNERAMSQAMTRLSTGSRINSAIDDAAGLAISERMSSQISGLNMAARNANDAISLLQTVEGATKEITSMLGRMRELSVQAASGTYSTTDREALNLEFEALMTEIDRIADDTEWNGDKILAGTNATTETASGEVALAKTIQIGTDTGQTMALSINSWQPTVQHDTSMSDASGTARTGVDDRTNEISTVTFGAMTAGQTLTMGGITITAADAITADELATYFELYSATTDEGTAKALTSAAAGTDTISGAWTGFTVADASGATNAVKFTNLGRHALNPVSIAGTASGTTVTATAQAGVDNAGAYGEGIFYWGGSTTIIDIKTTTAASQALQELDLAILGAGAERAKYGAYMSRLQHASDNLVNVATNTAASRSQIADADYAAETTELARTQIISQASTAMLAQANQVKQTVLALLK